MVANFAGAPIKSVKLTTPNGQSSRAEFVITARGIESGAVYALSAELAGEIAAEGATYLTLDLMPDVDLATLTARLSLGQGKRSLGDHMRKTTGLKGAKRALVFELTDEGTRADPARLAAAIKALRLPLTAAAPIDEAISTAGGVAWGALSDDLMLTALPGVFCAGEMIDWDAPTGGYLITACLATGAAAAAGVARWLFPQGSA